MFRASILTLILLLTSCVPPVKPVDPTPVDPLPPPVGDHIVTGIWYGGLFSEANFTVRIVLWLEEDGGKVIGFAVFPDETQATRGDITGTVDDEVRIQIVVTDGIETLTFTLIGVVDEDNFSGLVTGLLQTSGTFKFGRIP